ncbi:MAG TPA: sulfatase [Thermoanaerobaculia bacterium]|nr:sulfatase [Thermoanaerobaculia bacterium]
MTRFGFALLVLLAAACGPRPAVEPPLGWQRVDLAEETPRVELDLHAGFRGPAAPFVQRIGYLGAEEVRDMSRVPASQLQAFPFRRAPQIRVVEQTAGVRLAWRLALGEEPYASFIPVGWRDRECRCLYRLGLRDARGGLHELYRSEAGEVSRQAPGAVEIDLADFAGSAVDVLFQVDLVVRPGERPVPPPGGPLPALEWGSPAVYGRKPVAGWLPGEPERPNLLVLGIDTLRADHVGAFRAGPALAPSLTPAIDRLAEESDVWLRAFATFNTTNPSFASIFTGLYGKNHGVYDLKTPLPEAHATLAELVSAAGYETLAIVSASHLGHHNSGLGQGFGRMLLAEHTFAGELAVDAAMDWIEKRPARAAGAGRPGAPPPFFAWLHLFDPHTPHTPPGPFAAGFRAAGAMGLHPVASWIPFRRPGDRSFEEPVLGGERDLYAGEVAYLDRQVDRVLGFLESRGLLERTVVALVADHGENLGEHGIDYRHTGLWDTTVHVPLLVRWPAAPGRGEGRRLDGLVQTLDLFPTLLAATGVELPAGWTADGTDLRQLTHDGRPGRRAVFAEHVDATGAMVRTADHKYLRMRRTPGVPAGAYLYDLAKDPAEERNLAGRGLPVERELAALLDRWLRDRRPAPAAESRTLSEEEEAKLRALGYLN